MITIKAVLRKKKLADGKYPIVLRITKNRRSKIFKTPYSAQVSEWNTKSGEFKKQISNYIQKNRLLNKYKQRAYKIITELEIENEYYTLEDFEQKFRLNRNPIQQNIFTFGEEVVADMRKAGRIENARFYNDTLNSLKKIQRNRHLTFKEVDVAYLDKYETFLRSRGGSDGGIGARMRAIRALFNLAIKHNYISESLYPFKVYKVSKLKSQSIKRALTLEQVNKIAVLDLKDHQHLVHYKNYFLFSFYTRGMNYADMVHLTWDDVYGDRIHYTRSKTKTNFQVKIMEPVKDILEFYKHYPSNTNYIFPILLAEGLSPNQIENRKKKILTQYNSALKEIGKLCEIKQPITTYVARHSFATCLKNKGVSTDVISESLGHKNLAVTQFYLKNFVNTVLDEAAEVLL